MGEPLLTFDNPRDFVAQGTLEMRTLEVAYPLFKMLGRVSDFEVVRILKYLHICNEIPWGQKPRLHTTYISTSEAVDTSAESDYT